MTAPPDRTCRDTYRFWTRDLARFGDTDRQGHINNAAYATYSETGRVAFLNDALGGSPRGTAPVIVRLEMDFRAEMQWGGEVEIGTAVLSVGRSSFRIAQGIFKAGVCSATAECVLVLMDDETRRSVPVPDELRARMLGFSLLR